MRMRDSWSEETGHGSEGMINTAINLQKVAHNFVNFLKLSSEKITRKMCNLPDLWMHLCNFCGNYILNDIFLFTKGCWRTTERLIGKSINIIEITYYFYQIIDHMTPMNQMICITMIEISRHQKWILFFQNPALSKLHTITQFCACP